MPRSDDMRGRTKPRSKRTATPASGDNGSPTESGSRRKPRERYDERQAEVIDIAARVFAERGYHATSIEDLVEATGLQRGGLYHYMDGKKDLLIRIHRRFIDPLLEDAQDIAERGEPAEETLRLLTRALMHDIATYRDQVTVFLNEWRIIEHDPEWAEIRRSRRAFEEVVTEVIERGCEEGAFAVKDVRIAVLGFLGMVNYSYQWYRPGGRGKPQDIADQFFEIFSSGIRSD
jgi:AcrR family transcriptional regulator